MQHPILVTCTAEYNATVQSHVPKKGFPKPSHPENKAG